MQEYRVHGSPGTGKTTYTAAWVEKAAQRFGSHAIMVTSFTRAAAIELTRRGLPVEDRNVGTLHAICYRAFGRPKLAEDEISAWNEHAPAYALSRGKSSKAAIEDLSEHVTNFGTEGDKLSLAAQTLRAKMVERERWPDRVRAFQTRWEAWKKEVGVMDFTDLIEQGKQVLPRAPGDIAVLFADECQDLAPLELSLLRSWAEHTEFLVLVGDADQCLYSFKGSTPRAFLEPELPPDHERNLTQSWRVPRAVHEKAVSWIEQCSYRHDTGYQPRDGEGELRRSSDAHSYPFEVVQQLAELPPFDNAMVLATCGYMLNDLTRELRARGVLFHNPYRLTNGAWNPTRGGVDRLRALLASHSSVRGDLGRRWWTWSELDTWFDCLAARGVLKNGAKVWVETRAKDRETRDAVLLWTDLEQLFEPAALASLADAHSNQRADVLVAWYGRAALGSKRPLLEYGLAVTRHFGAQRLFDEPNVVVGTVHSVKGAEANHVWLFPDLSPQGYEEWHTKGEPRDSVLRQMYVGMTRARETLTLCSAASARSVDWD